jgi:hypothetical protein
MFHPFISFPVSIRIKNGSVLKSKQESKEPKILFDLLNFAAESYLGELELRYFVV